MVNETAVVVFDDERAVANAGVILPALLARRLGLEALVGECVDLGERPGAANPQLVELGHDCREHARIIDCVVRSPGLDIVLLGEIGELDAAIDHGAREWERVVENQLIEALQPSAGAPQHWNIEFLPVVGDDEVDPHELAESPPHIRHRRRAD